MPFNVERRSEICKRNNNRPGCCWYLCDNPKKSLCKNCYSCYSNCPHDVYEIINDEIYVKVNHVMEGDHFIMWIALVNEKVNDKVKLLVNEPAECKFKYIKGSKLYAYCNKHGLWTCDVK